MPPRVVGVNQVGNGIDTWYFSLPPITRTYGTIVFAFTTLVSLGFISPVHFALFWPMVYKKLEVWRLLTNFFFIGKFSFPFVIKMLWIANYGVALERQAYTFDPADYLYMLCVTSVTLLLTTLVIPMVFCAESLVFVLLYLWSRHFPEQQVSLYGLIQIQSFYLPFAFMGLSFIMGQSIMGDILGIVAGHVYYFFKELYPRQGGREFLATPEWFKNTANHYLPQADGYGGVAPPPRRDAGGAPQPPPPQADPGFRAFGGSGRRLGDT